MGCLSDEWYETEFNAFVLKDSDYNIMMMSTCSGLTVIEVQTEEIMIVNGEVYKLDYPEVVAGYYKYRREVDNHNALRHDGGTKYENGLVSARGTTWCTIRFLVLS